MIARMLGPLDARRAATGDARELAVASRWIAANTLAIRGARSRSTACRPGPAVVGVRVAGFDGLLGALATVPSLLDPRRLPRSWRFALRAIGVPFLDRPVRLALEGRAPVLRLVQRSWTLDVVDDVDRHVVRVASTRALAA